MSNPPEPNALQQIIDAVVATPKYGRLCRPLIERVAAAEMSKHRKQKDAVKAIKNKLHQVAGAYLNATMPYDKWLAQLQAADTPAERQDICRTIMAAHTSTNERLGLLDEMYGWIAEHTGPAASVLDVACGLNPLAASWMHLAPNATYLAVDVFTDMMDFLRDALPLLGVGITALADDVVQSIPDHDVDVAYVLKTIPCLEQTDKQIGPALLRRIRARFIVVSFPVKSLGGREKGMAQHYDSHFRTMMDGVGDIVAHQQFSTEVIYIVTIPK